MPSLASFRFSFRCLLFFLCSRGTSQIVLIGEVVSEAPDDNLLSDFFSFITSVTVVGDFKDKIFITFSVKSLATFSF